MRGMHIHFGLRGSIFFWGLKMTFVVILLILICVVALFPQVASAFPESLSGNIQITNVNSESDISSVQSLEQRYALNWERQLSEYVSLRGLLTYNRFGTDLSEGGNTWRRQVRPQGELQWNHPRFSLLSSISRRNTTSNDRTTNLVQNSYDISATPHFESVVTSNLALSFARTYNTFDRSRRNSRDWVFRGNLSRAFGSAALNYTLTHENNRIASSSLRQSSTTQRLRWSQGGKLFSDRLGLSADYTLDRRTQSDKLLGADTTVRPIDILSTLYSKDASPEFGELLVTPSLSDGDITSPTDPVIEIGRGIGDQNIGIDFGFTRFVRAFYIYTDKPSGAGLRWNVFTSEDNVVWRSLTATPVVVYNADFQRYEVTVDSVESRYVKLVNVGLNDVIDVNVTELQALEEFTRDRESSRSQTIHRVTTAMTYRLSHALRTKVDFYIREEPGNSFSNSRNEIVYGSAVIHTPSKDVTQSLSWQKSHEEFGATDGRDENTTYSYALKARSSDAVSASVNLYSRSNTLNYVRFQETNSASLLLSGIILPEFRVRAEGLFNRNNQFGAKQKFDTWTWRGGFYMTLTSTLKVDASILYQTTSEVDAPGSKIRRVYSGAVDYQVTPAITLRGTLTAGNDNNQKYLSQDYSGAWRFSPRLSSSAVVTLISSDDASRLEREVLRLNYKANLRTSFYAGFSSTEAGTGSGVRSIQLGLRTGF